MTLGELAAGVGVPVDDLRQDLVMLRGAGLVVLDANTRLYRLNPAPVADLGQLLRVSVRSGADLKPA